MWATKEQMARDVRRELARRSFEFFVREVTPNYLMGWVHRKICTELDQFLQDSLNGRSPRLMIMMPPRSGKSELASRKFPAYALGRYPDLQFIATSYSADLASRMSRDVQRCIESSEYTKIFPSTRLSSGRDGYSRTTDLFEIVQHNGAYRSAGVGGGITGMGGNILVIDDPFKDRESADSPVQRLKVWEWYTSTLYTRLAPGGGILLINTRWHTGDLSGRLLEIAARKDEDEHAEQWKIVSFPAIATQDEEFRKAGEPLHPERYDLPALLRIKQAIGSRNWEALYQQNPVPDGGAIFLERWFKFWFHSDLPQTFDQMAISWDLAFKAYDTNDYVAGTVWGKKGADFYLLDILHQRLTFTQTLAAIRDLHAKWPKAKRIFIEDAANGPAVIDSLSRSIPGIIPVKADGSKESRAHSVTPLFEAGNVWLPHPSLHRDVQALITEFLQFPYAEHDDLVDSTTQAIREMTRRRTLALNAELAKPAPTASLLGAFSYGR